MGLKTPLDQYHNPDCGGPSYYDYQYYDDSNPTDVQAATTTTERTTTRDFTCPSGNSKETITLGFGESLGFSTQETDTYGKNVKCVVKFKRGRRSKCKLKFSCSAFSLTAKNSDCNRGSDFVRIGGDKFCADDSPDVTVNSRTLNVHFHSQRRSRGGTGAECTATCIGPQEPSSSAPTNPTTTTPPPATTPEPTTGVSHSGKEGLLLRILPQQNTALLSNVRPSVS